MKNFKYTEAWGQYTMYIAHYLDLASSVNIFLQTFFKRNKI